MRTLSGDHGNHTEMPIVAALDNFSQKKPLRFHVPGHGGGQALHPAMRQANLPGWDVTELDGLDDLHNPSGVIELAQKKAAGLYGARHTFFLINGTTVGIQALIAAACCEPDSAIALPRNVHRSVLGGLVFSGARPVFIEPQLVPGFDFAAGFTGAALKQVLQAVPEIAAVLAVHPCYYGVVGNLAEVAEICHRYNIPLLADEAHGTHLRFSPHLPPDALEQGADATVQSVHKTGGALTQASWLHLAEGGRVDRKKVAGVLRLLQSSSPSYLLMASLDAARQQLALCGRASLDAALDTALEAARAIKAIPGLTVLGPEHLARPGAVDYDPTRLVVSFRELGLSGYEASRLLAEEYNIYVEMADIYNIVAVLPIGVNREEVGALVHALAGISGQVRGAALKGDSPPLTMPQLPPQIMTPRLAWLARKRQVRLETSAGLVSAEAVAVQPPGIAVIYPGEEITPAIIEYLMVARDHGLQLHGAADPRLGTIEVVDC